MKKLLIVVCVYFFVFKSIESETTEYIENMSNETSNEDFCFNMSGIDPEHLFFLNHIERLEKSEREEFKYKIGCYASCLFQQYKVMDGPHIQISDMIELFKSDLKFYGPYIQKEIDEFPITIEMCAKQVEIITDACEVGWKFVKCMKLISNRDK
ncbi:uncharacterized protein LOC118446901 [Vespa mandarinia]|uniref:uncharacterized protein LOC118446901 n=1 Tax=Vespa mandarinia TaxID=7446 RepID=UPI00160AAD03|nr:uncharacterized protein LOC118446901 [Vespa mandarinia]